MEMCGRLDPRPLRPPRLQDVQQPAAAPADAQAAAAAAAGAGAAAAGGVAGALLSDYISLGILEDPSAAAAAAAAKAAAARAGSHGGGGSSRPDVLERVPWLGALKGIRSPLLRLHQGARWVEGRAWEAVSWAAACPLCILKLLAPTPTLHCHTQLCNDRRLLPRPEPASH